MRRAIIFALLFFLPTILHARVIQWDGKRISVSVATERLTRIEFPEDLRSVLLARAEFGIEREGRSLFIRALEPGAEDTLFAIGESGTAYELKLFVGDNSDSTVVISHQTQSLLAQTSRATKVPALDLMRSMVRGLPVEGYKLIDAVNKEVYRDANFSMKLIKAYRSPVLDGYVIEVENIAPFPVLLRVQDFDFKGLVAISSNDDYLHPRPSKASEIVQGRFRTYLYIVALPGSNPL